MHSYVCSNLSMECGEAFLSSVKSIPRSVLACAWFNIGGPLFSEFGGSITLPQIWPTVWRFKHWLASLAIAMSFGQSTCQKVVYTYIHSCSLTVMGTFFMFRYHHCEEPWNYCQCQRPHMQPFTVWHSKLHKDRRRRSVPLSNETVVRNWDHAVGKAFFLKGAQYPPPMHGY